MMAAIAIGVSRSELRVAWLARCDRASPSGEQQMRRYYYPSGKQLSGRFAYLVNKRVTWEEPADRQEWRPVEGVISVVNYRDPRNLCVKDPTHWIEADGLRARNIVIHGLSDAEAELLREQLQQAQATTKYGPVAWHTADVCQGVCGKFDKKGRP